MHVMVIGGGGREHAMAWRIARSTRVKKVYVAPGNAGTAATPKTENVDLDVSATDELVACAIANNVDLTIVGPEAPLAAGVVDAFVAAGLRCFGPSQAAAQLESSKAFAKLFLDRHAIPTAAYGTFEDVEAAKAYVREQGAPIVVKADGLAAGKGVVIAETVDEACAAIDDMLTGNAFGAAGHRVVVEQCLRGEEASFIVMVSGESIVPLASSQDHKARDDGDLGPNTGGMGAYSPAPVIDAAMHARIMREVIEPTVRGMAADGIPYTGFLYAGLMIDDTGVPYVLEFNCRLGDPETQPIMMRLQSDLVDLCDAALDGTLHEQEVKWDPRVALGVVMAAGGYPASYSSGDEIAGLGGDNADVRVFHAGTRYGREGVVTAGGRVLCVCALGDNVSAAKANAYARVSQIQWDNVYYRTDIGYRAVAREAS